MKSTDIWRGNYFCQNIESDALMQTELSKLARLEMPEHVGTVKVLHPQSPSHQRSLQDGRPKVEVRDKVGVAAVEISTQDLILL